MDEQKQRIEFALEPGERGGHDLVAYVLDAQNECVELGRASLCALIHEYAEAMDDVEEDSTDARTSFAQWLTGHAAGMVSRLVVADFGEPEQAGAAVIPFRSDGRGH